MNYKYTTRFESPIISCALNQEEFISKASLENLKPLLPKDIDFSENVDLLGVAFNAAVVNKFNKNDDGMDSATAVKIIKNFLHKPTNIEHNKEKVVGHIISAGFSEYKSDNKLISTEEAAELNTPYNIALGAVVYKYSNREFADLIQRSVDPSDSMYQSLSTSWEVGFSDYVIAIGSDDLKDAEIVKNPKAFQEMKAKLRAYGGSGRLDDGTKIYRLLAGEIYPLGIGFTTTPAADVKGIYSNVDEAPNVQIKDKRDKKTYFDIKKPVFNEKKDKAISQIQFANVKNKKETIMDVEKLLSELKDLLVEKKFSEESVASMTQTFADAIKQKDAEYRESLTQAETEKQALAKEREELKASVEKIEQQLQEAAEKIAEFESMRQQEEALARFNSRMEVLDREYDLDDEDRQVLAEDLKSIEATEEAFAAYQRKLSVMWKNKNKEAKAALDKAIQEKIDAEVAKKLGSVAKASASTDPEEKEDEEEVAEVAEEALANATASNAGLPSSNEQSSKAQPTLRQKFAQAFNRENIVIS